MNFDFDEAQSKLKECKTVIENDFFIVGCLDEFTENARLIISEIFCRIHQVCICSFWVFSDLLYLVGLIRFVLVRLRYLQFCYL